MEGECRGKGWWEVSTVVREDGRLVQGRGRVEREEGRQREEGEKVRWRKGRENIRERKRGKNNQAFSG